MFWTEILFYFFLFLLIYKLNQEKEYIIIFVKVLSGFVYFENVIKWSQSRHGVHFRNRENERLTIFGQFVARR